MVRPPRFFILNRPASPIYAMERSTKYTNTIICLNADQYIVANLTENTQYDLSIDEKSNIKTSTQYLFTFEEPSIKLRDEYIEKGFESVAFVSGERNGYDEELEVIVYSEMSSRLPILQTLSVMMLLELCVAKLEATYLIGKGKKPDKDLMKKVNNYDCLMLGLRSNYANILDGIGNIILSWKGVTIIEDMTVWGAQEAAIKNGIVNSLARDRVTKNAAKVTIGEFRGLAVYSVDLIDIVHKHAKLRLDEWDVTDAERPEFFAIYNCGADGYRLFVFCPADAADDKLENIKKAIKILTGGTTSILEDETEIYAFACTPKQARRVLSIL